MKYLNLKRVALNIEGVFGVLLFENIPFAVTLEPEDKNNRINISCIPENLYLCKRIKSPLFGDTFEITDVKNRTNILFHKGNMKHNTRGCILIAESYNNFNGKSGIADSKKGYDEFMSLLKDDSEFRLHISQC